MSEHRFAEKLTILAEHSQGLLARLHRVKQVRKLVAALTRAGLLGPPWVWID